jgi:hypothetical protein
MSEHIDDNTPIGDKRAREESVKDLRKQLLDAPRPTSVAELAAECRAFHLRLIDGNKVAALAIGRDVIARWWDVMRLLPRDGMPAIPKMPDLPDLDAKGAFLDVVLGDGRMDELKRVVDVAFNWCAAAGGPMQATKEAAGQAHAGWPDAKGRTTNDKLLSALADLRQLVKDNPKIKNKADDPHMSSLCDLDARIEVMSRKLGLQFPVVALLNPFFQKFRFCEIPYQRTPSENGVVTYEFHSLSVWEDAFDRFRGLVKAEKEYLGMFEHIAPPTLLLPVGLRNARDGAILLASLADDIRRILTSPYDDEVEFSAEGDKEKVMRCVKSLQEKGHGYCADIEAIALELSELRKPDDPFSFGEIIASSAHEAAMKLAIEIYGRVWFAATLEFVSLEPNSMDLNPITEKFDAVRVHFEDQVPVYPAVQKLIVAIQIEAAHAAGRRRDRTGPPPANVELQPAPTDPPAAATAEPKPVATPSPPDNPPILEGPKAGKAEDDVSEHPRSLKEVAAKIFKFGPIFRANPPADYIDRIVGLQNDLDPAFEASLKLNLYGVVGLEEWKKAATTLRDACRRLLDWILNRSWRDSRRQPPLLSDDGSLHDPVENTAKMEWTDRLGEAVIAGEDFRLLTLGVEAEATRRAESATKPQASDDATETPAAETDDAQDRHELKPPSAEALAAYRLFILQGKTQTAIAEELTIEWGKPVNQGSVSRWIKQSGAWIKAGNVLPGIENKSAKPVTMDPAQIELGERQDSLTKRQRDKRTEE